jgi:HAMP domain-containing protein
VPDGFNDFIAERKAELRAIAQGDVGEVSKPGLNERLAIAGLAHPSFEVLQINDVSATVVASTDRSEELSTRPSGSTFANSLSVETMGQVGPDWILTAPIVGSDTKAQGVLVGEVFLGVMGRLLNPYGLDTSTVFDQEVHIVNAKHLLVYSSDWGVVPDDATMAAKGALSVKGEGAIFDRAMASGSGADQIVDYRNEGVLAGYQALPALGWVIIASTQTDVALAPVREQELRTSLLQALSTFLLIGFAIALAVLTTRPLVALSRTAALVSAGDLTARVELKGGAEVRRLGDSFNAMVERLSDVLNRLRGEVTESAAKLSAASTLSSTTRIRNGDAVSR